MPELLDILDKNGNKTGRLHERGTPLQKGEFLLGTHVWTVNSKKEYLITRRSKAKGHRWHAIGGMAVSGDDSLTTALKEAEEEVGLKLDPENAQFFKREPWVIDGKGCFHDVWIFRQDIDINDVVLQEEEACDVMWASESKIRQLIADGTWVPDDWYVYIEELFTEISAWCEI